MICLHGELGPTRQLLVPHSNAAPLVHGEQRERERDQWHGGGKGACKAAPLHMDERGGSGMVGESRLREGVGPPAGAQQG